MRPTWHLQNLQNPTERRSVQMGAKRGIRARRGLGDVREKAALRCAVTAVWQDEPSRRAHGVTCAKRARTGRYRVGTSSLGMYLVGWEC